MFKGTYLFQPIILGIHVSFRGCIRWVWPPPRMPVVNEGVAWDPPIKNVIILVGTVTAWRIITVTTKWLITMVIVSPLRIGLWDPFQMA